MAPMEILVALLMIVGVIGIVVPVLPGLLLVFASVLAWAVWSGSSSGWVVFAVAAVIYLVGMALQWWIPGQRMRRAGVKTSTLLVGVACAIVMAFVIPVIGLFVGFPLGIFLVSMARSRDLSMAVQATSHALRAVGLNILIELCASFAIIAVWAISVLWIVD